MAQTYPVPPDDATLVGQPLPPPPPQGQDQGGGYAGFEQPMPPIVQQMHQPATSPQEIEMRKNGWMQVLDRVGSDPNLMRAIGMFGAAVGQPLAPGESPVGRVAASAMIGTSAYDYGKEAEYQRQRQQTADVMAQQTHVANLEGKQAETATRKAQLPGIQAESEIKVGTKEAVIQRARNEARKAEIDLETATSQKEREAILLRKEKELEQVWLKLPPELKTEAMLAELKKPMMELKAKEADIKLRGAQEVQARAQAGMASEHGALFRSQRFGTDLDTQAEASILATEGPAAMLAARARGRGAPTSAQVQHDEYFKQQWKLANAGKYPNDPQKLESEAAAAVVRMRTNLRTKDDVEFLPDFKREFPGPRGETADQTLARLREFRARAEGREATPRPGGPEAAGGGQAVSPGTVIKNQSTGERRRWDGTQWVKING